MMSDSEATEKLDNLLLYCFIVCARAEYRLEVYLQLTYAQIHSTAASMNCKMKWICLFDII